MDDPTTSGVTEGFGLMFYNARWYDPYLNHFTQPDSIVPNPSNSQDYDRYAYARNNPLRYTDPSGHVTCEGSNWDDGPQCVKKNSKAYDRNDPNNYTHFVHYQAIVICGWETEDCGYGDSSPAYAGIPMSPYWNYANEHGLISDPEKQTYIAINQYGYKFIAAEQAGTYMNTVINKDKTIRFIIFAHSAGADSAVLLAAQFGRNAVAGLVLLDPPLDAGHADGVNHTDLHEMANEIARTIPVFEGTSQFYYQQISRSTTSSYPGGHYDFALSVDFVNSRDFAIFMTKNFPYLP